MRTERVQATLTNARKTVDVARLWFDDLTDLLAHVEAWEPKHRSRTAEADMAWDGGVDQAQAFEYGKHGWPEGAEKTNGRIAQVIAQGDFVKSLFYFTDEPGQYDLADIARALSGDREYWFTERHEKGFGEPKFVRILTNATASAVVDAATLYNRALALACLVALFERAEIHTEVWVATTSDGRRGRGAEALTRLKSFYEPLDAERIAFAIGHPAFTRRIGFVCDEMMQQPEFRDIWNDIEQHYGWPMEVTKEAKEIIQPDIEFGEMLGGREDIDWNDQEQVMTWLEKTLAAHGVTVTLTREKLAQPVPVPARVEVIPPIPATYKPRPPLRRRRRRF